MTQDYRKLSFQLESEPTDWPFRHCHRCVNFLLTRKRSGLFINFYGYATWLCCVTDRQEN